MRGWQCAINTGLIIPNAHLFMGPKPAQKVSLTMWGPRQQLSKCYGWSLC